MLRSSFRRAMVVSVLATLVAGIVVVLLARASGVSSVGHAFSNVRPSWVVVLVVAELLTIPAYVLSYRGILGLDRHPPRLPLIAWLVLAGFGPFAIRGGFGFDQHALRVLESDARSARVRVLSLSALEWVVLAPAAWIASIVLLVRGTNVMGSLLWPWAVVTPLGLAVGLWSTAPERDLSWLRRRRLDVLAQAVEAIGVVHRLLRHPLAGWQAWLGTAGYWVTDIAALYAACQMFGLHVGAGKAVVAYGTGYVVTRRALPLGGAGITEFLLTYALHWVGAPLAPALAAVIAYRVFNFILAAAPALLAHRRLDQWLNHAVEPASPTT